MELIHHFLILFRMFIFWCGSLFPRFLGETFPILPGPPGGGRFSTFGIIIPAVNVFPNRMAFRNRPVFSGRWSPLPTGFECQ